MPAAQQPISSPRSTSQKRPTAAHLPPVPQGVGSIPLPPNAARPQAAAVSSAPPPADTESRLCEAQQLAEQLAAIVELNARLEASEDLSAAAGILANELQRHLQAVLVAVAVVDVDSAKCRLAAISQAARFDPQSPLAQTAEAALQETAARGEPIVWSARGDGERAGVLAHRQFAEQTHAATLISMPLTDGAGQLQAVWLVADPAPDANPRLAARFLKAAAKPTAATLELIRRAERGTIARNLTALQRFLGKRRGQAALIALILTAFLLCLPAPFHPRCTCVVEPTTRAYVAAPFAGPLKQALVKPGDRVEAGQLLAEMDGRENRWQLSSVRAELHRAQKTLAGHLAAHEPGKAVVAELEVERLRSELRVLENRAEHVKIRSPLDGVVVTGDHHDAVGMPLETGQSLFEVAALERMRVELNVAEEDVRFVRPGQSVKIRFDAFPLRPIDARLLRIHPRSEIRDEANVFVAEVQLPKPILGLRPGMRGLAWVASESQPLGWILFRKPWATLVAWLGW